MSLSTPSIHRPVGTTLLTIAIALAGLHDFPSFVAAEMVHRRAHNYPPFQRLIRIIVRSRNQQEAGDFSETMAAAFRSAQERRKQEGRQTAEVRLLGPAEAPVFRLKDYFRFHFQLQSASPRELHELTREAWPTLHPPSGVEFTLDVDPFNMQ